MPGVFVSYCRPSAQVAEQVAAALTSIGYDVWRDDQLPAHRAYGDVIEENLRAAGAVVVLWSSEACQSQWVRAEADYARLAGRLVQVSLDGTIPPLPFNQIQCADLSGWDGDAGAPGWRKVAQSVAALAPIGKGDPESQSHANRLSVCVLPFQNMSGDAEQEYFSDGISEDITTDLSKVSALCVTARNTSFTFKCSSMDVPTIARKLGVSHVLEGSVRKAGARVRITAQLIDGASGDHVWAERYDRELTDIFAIQDEISKAIVGALKLKLLPEEQKAIEQRGTTSAEAYNLYLMAREYWVSGNYGDIRREERVIRICQRAVELDPLYARAWALMAIAQSNLRFSFGRPGPDGLSSAERALSIDPHMAEAHCVKAKHLFEAEHVEDANEEIDIALRLDSESWEANREAARLFYRQGRFADAATHFEKAVSIFDTDFHAWGMLSSCYEAMGDEDGVQRAATNMVSQSERVLSEDPSNAAALGIGAGGLAIQGEMERTKDWIERALLIDPENLNMRYNFACITALYIQDADAAFDLLEPVFEGMTPSLYRNALVDPDLDSLREMSRFKTMIKKAEKRLGLRSPGPAIPAAT